MSKPEDTYTRNGLAIINPYGGIWTDRIFASDEEAMRYLRDYWGEKEDISRFKIAPAYLELKLQDFGGKPRIIPLSNGDRA
jgi:hypothetical protein